ncbi:hypothetical protein Ddc_03743 [Ditylenchus destructor]|nr:hypothetical protein Ddc_03743 [Ditylenchus destructor]
MGKDVSDGKGEFAIYGETHEFFQIEPFMKVMMALSGDVKQCPSNPQAVPGYTVCAIRLLDPGYIIPGHFNWIYFDIGTLTFRRGDATQGSHIWSKTWPKSQDPIDEEACHENIHLKKYDQ